MPQALTASPRVALEAWLGEVWYGGRRGGALLLPLSWVFGLASRARRAAYRRGWLHSERVPVPVIVVGNITVGGTGKTPLVIWLAQRLRERGHQPGVVTRGYGGAATCEPLEVTAQSDPALVGDEAVLISRRSAVPVVAAQVRAAAARALLERGVDVILSDDGLQHYGLTRDLEIVVLDGQRLTGNGRLLPAGPLREPPSRLREVDAVVVNGGRPAAGRFHMRIEAREAVALASGAREPLDRFAGRRVHAIAGTGNPERFFDTLRACGLQVVAHRFPDHARYTPEDIRLDLETPVLMTEKDAVKCAAFADHRHWYVPVDARFEASEADALMGLIEDRMRAHEPAD